MYERTPSSISKDGEEFEFDENDDDDEEENKRVVEAAKHKKQKSKDDAAKKRAVENENTAQLLHDQRLTRIDFSTRVANPIVVDGSNNNLFVHFENRVSGHLCSSSNSSTNNTINGCSSADSCQGSHTLATCGHFSLAYKYAVGYEKADIISLSRNKQPILTMMGYLISHNGANIHFERYSNQLPTSLHKIVFGYSFKIFCYLLGESIPELMSVQLTHGLSAAEFCGFNLLDGISFDKWSDNISCHREKWDGSYRKEGKSKRRAS